MPGFNSSSAVLVIAPDADLRHSLAFMLSAEGFSVETGNSWPPESIFGQPKAVVIDHGALSKGFVDDGRLTALRDKAIILIGRDGRTPPLPEATIVRKPLLDGALVTALRNALSVQNPAANNNDHAL